MNKLNQLLMDKLELYNKATEAYYSGEELIPDYEYDALEEGLGLKNKNLGSSHSKAYTIKHPYIMGSLSKVQVHSSDAFMDYFQGVNKYIRKHYNWSIPCIITPKYDGCSFEVIYSKGNIIQASTRGDGTYGKDITPLIKALFTRKQIKYASDKVYCLRGELLIKKDTFAKKYTQEFKNPRSYVSGLVNADWSEDLIPRVYDLTPVVYEICYQEQGAWVEQDWFNDKYLKKFIPTLHLETSIGTAKELMNIYNRFEDFRDHIANVPLDGIVIKPTLKYRYRIRTEYPDDCVAIKFKPMLQETVVENIEWSIGKTNELIPTIIVKPVVMDGKTITRASAHNYGYLISNKVSIGTKLTLSLAGDIIPYIYNINDTSAFNPKNLGIIAKNVYIDGCHLYLEPSDEYANHLKFINSAITLKIPEIGEATAKEIFENIKWRNHKKPYNLLCLKPHTIFKALGRGKRAKNALESFKKVRNKLTLSEIIQSCNFESCGPKVANQIQHQLVGQSYDYSHLPEKAYKWATDINSLEYKELQAVLSYMKLSLNDFEITDEGSKIPIIMTGKPSNYKTKGDFLAKHPEYKETSSWSEVKIVFTGSLSSTSSKMKKAIEKGIDIQLY